MRKINNFGNPFYFVTMEKTLTIPEELFLLTVNETTGRKAPIRSKKFDILLSAAILMELALLNRIDTDPEWVIPDRREPTGIPFLDEPVEMIGRAPKQEKITWWLLRLSEKASRFRNMVVSGMVIKGLLKMEKERVFLGFTTSTYPILINNSRVAEVKTRVRELITGDGFPELRDMVIISMAWYGGLLNLMLPEELIKSCQPRIEQIASMDLVGQAISKSMKELTLTLAISMKAQEILGKKSAEEKMDDLVEEMKVLMHVGDQADLPEWLRKGTEQYGKTLDFIGKTGTNEIFFNAKTGEYGLKTWAGLR